MKPTDTGFILPYGVMVGGHVTPIDHMYFSPVVFDSPTGTYPVYAMADSRIVDIGMRQHQGQGQNSGKTVTDYRFVFSVSCHLLYYYDLVNSLTPSLKKLYDASKQPGHSLNVPVKAGERIGSIGGQTLDFAIWDMEHTLSGIVNPSDYVAERWKIHTVDPLKYVTMSVKAKMLTKYVRTVSPVSGRIDYDVAGRLSGTWFKKGTNGYAGAIGRGQSGYWTGHLVFAPNWYDPAQWMISIGRWKPDASQFAILGNAPDPRSVSVATGLVKYDLTSFDMYDQEGNRWDQMTYVKPVHMVAGTDSAGCILAQLIGTKTLKVQVFQGTACSNVDGFTAAMTYTR